MRRTSAGVLLALALSLGVRAAAQGGSVTDQAVSLRYGANHWSGFPSADLVGATAGDPVYQSGWWYRVFEDTREYPLGPPDSVSYADGHVTAVWNNLDGKGFGVIEEPCVVDNEGPSGGYVSNLRITNLNGRSGASRYCTTSTWTSRALRRETRASRSAKTPPS